MSGLPLALALVGAATGSDTLPTTRWEVAGGLGFDFERPREKYGTPIPAGSLGPEVLVGRTLRCWLQPQARLSTHGLGRSREHNTRLLSSFEARFSLCLPSGRPVVFAVPGLGLSWQQYWGADGAGSGFYPGAHLGLGLRVAHEPHYTFDVMSTPRQWFGTAAAVSPGRTGLSILGGTRF